MKRYVALLTVILLSCSKDNGLFDPPGSEESNEIVFISRRIENSADWQLYIMNPDGTEQRKLTDDIVTCQPPVVSPDGENIAYTTYQGNIFKLWVVNRNGENKKSSSPEGPGIPSNLRVLGYLYSDNYWNSHFNSDLSQLTDLNLAFVNPDENGEFTLNNNEVTDLVGRAHASNVRVYISLGGAEPPLYVTDLLKDDKRATLVNNLAALTEQFNLDGIDVDLEGNFIDENYPHFVSELHAALKAKNKNTNAAQNFLEKNFIH